MAFNDLLVTGVQLVISFLWILLVVEIIRFFIGIGQLFGMGGGDAGASTGGGIGGALNNLNPWNHDRQQRRQAEREQRENIIPRIERLSRSTINRNTDGDSVVIIAYGRGFASTQALTLRQGATELETTIGDHRHDRVSFTIQLTRTAAGQPVPTGAYRLDITTPNGTATRVNAITINGGASDSQVTLIVDPRPVHVHAGTVVDFPIRGQNLDRIQQVGGTRELVLGHQGGDPNITVSVDGFNADNTRAMAHANIPAGRTGLYDLGGNDDMGHTILHVVGAVSVTVAGVPADFGLELGIIESHINDVRARITPLQTAVGSNNNSQIITLVTQISMSEAQIQLHLEAIQNGSNQYVDINTADLDRLNTALADFVNVRKNMHNVLHPGGPTI